METVLHWLRKRQFAALIFSAIHVAQYTFLAIPIFALTMSYQSLIWVTVLPSLARGTPEIAFGIGKAPAKSMQSQRRLFYIGFS